jgi:RNA polymerase sigma-70 factor, ECF subfamily
MSTLLGATRAVDFDRLYRHHAASVYRYARAVLGNHADAEDVTQQTFLNAYRAVANGTKPRKAENWLLRIAHNEVRKHFRSNHRKTLEVELSEKLPERAPERSDPSLADVLRALQHLTPIQRSALVMREFEGRSYAEIAEIMEISQSALEAQIFRARRSLAEYLEGELTCAQAEEALLRRLDGRLPRRVARRLKGHLQECSVCERFGEVQKRQRALLRGLSVMPIPASLFLFRGEQAAAGGVGAGAVAASGSAGVGGGAAAAAAGGTGIAAGVVAKAAAVTAAAAVAGGVGYGVATSPETVRADAKVAHEAPIARPLQARPAAQLRPTRAAGASPARAGSAITRAPEKVTEARASVARPARHARSSARSEKARGGVAVARTRTSKRAVDAAPRNARAVTKAKQKSRSPRARPRPAADTTAGQGKGPRHQRPPRPILGAEQPKPLPGDEHPAPPKPPEHPRPKG